VPDSWPTTQVDFPLSKKPTYLTTYYPASCASSGRWSEWTLPFALRAWFLRPGLDSGLGADDLSSVQAGGIMAGNVASLPVALRAESVGGNREHGREERTRGL
jgi:hypothetical protein